MITSSDLFDVASRGIREDSSAAELSRAVSTLYYSLFHAALETARGRVADCTSSLVLQHYIASFDHMRLRDTALHVSAAADPKLRSRLKTGPAAWTALFPAHPSDEKRRVPSEDLIRFSETFAQMQQVRHQADYHPEWAVSFEDATTWRNDVNAARASWDRVRNTDEAIVFLFASLGVLTFR